MYRNQTKQWHFYLVLSGIVFFTTIGYVLDVQPGQASSASEAIAAEPTVPTVPTEEPTALATVPTVPPEEPTAVPTVPTVPTEEPTAVPTVPTVPTEEPTAVATVPTVPTAPTPVPTVPPVTPTAPANMIFMSTSRSGKVDGMRVKDEDIIAYNRDTDVWSMIMDGSDLGLNRLDVTDFYMMGDGTILMSFNRAFILPGLGEVDDSDILRFIPTQLGGDTQGAFEWFLDGSDVGLTSGGEDVDAIAFDPLGNLVISTKGSLHINELRGKDEDLFVLRNGKFGQDSAGTWELYFDGSAIGLTRGNEDIDGVWIDQATGHLYLTTKGHFAVTWKEQRMEGDGNDIFIVIPQVSGATIDYTFNHYFDINSVRLTKRIDGLALGLMPVFAPSLSNLTAPDAENEEENEAAQYTLMEEEEIDAAATDEEVDIYDQEAEEVEETTSQRAIYLPIINK